MIRSPRRTPLLPGTVALALVTLLAAGCATPPRAGSSIDGTTTTSSDGAPAPADVPVATASDKIDAPPPANVNPAPARMGLPGFGGNGTALGSVIVTNPLAPRTVDLTLRPDDIWERIRTGFGIPNIESPLVAEQQAWYLSHPDYLRRAVERSSRYLYHVVEELNKRGMPTELALLPFVESAYNPMAYSRARASGMWQFIPGTGKTYNLKQDWWRDERRDVIASTDAALAYLKTIYEMHGDWPLALASYNWGEGSVKRAIEKNRAAGAPTDYLSLSMPDETRNYVPKLQALKNIIANPDAFGVTLPHIDNEPYFVAVDRYRDIDLRTAARLANMSVEDFKALNPSFNRPVIPSSSGTALLVPADRADAFRTGLDSHQRLATWQAHTVQRKETVERIASHYGMTAAALREVNGLKPRAQVRPGQSLLVQKTGEGDVNLRFASFTAPREETMFSNVSAAPSTVQVRRGDTLYSIARRAGVSPEQMRAANRLKGNQVAVGQTLQIPSHHAPTTASSRSTSKRSVGHPTVKASAPSKSRVVKAHTSHKVAPR